MRYVSQGNVLEKTWEEIGNRCLECGGCTYVCPACTCFTVSDRQVGPDEIERVRIWDSCALSGFTRMAGGFNPRRAVHDRRNRRFFRKLAHYFIQRELSMACVGCGRCAAVCHGDIGMPSVVEMIRRATAEVEKSPMNHARPTENIYLPKTAVLDRVVAEIPEVKTFYWRFEDPAEQRAFQRFRPGQFAQVSLFGVGRVSRLAAAQPDRRRKPSSPIRQVGSCTAALHQLKPGDKFAVRGPYGNGFPMEEYYGKNLVFVAGGIGLIPLRSCIVYALAAPRQVPAHPDLSTAPRRRRN